MIVRTPHEYQSNPHRPVDVTTLAGYDLRVLHDAIVWLRSETTSNQQLVKAGIPSLETLELAYLLHVSAQGAW